MTTSGPLTKTDISVNVSTVADRRAVVRYSAVDSPNHAFGTFDWVDGLSCSRLPAEIVGSSPTGGMDICCECCVFVMDICCECCVLSWIFVVSVVCCHGYLL
jgi:hypothetical protein